MIVRFGYVRWNARDDELQLIFIAAEGEYASATHVEASLNEGYCAFVRTLIASVDQRAKRSREILSELTFSGVVK